MSSSDIRRPRVALATAPPLVADGLRTLLEADTDVTIVVEPTLEHFDVAIITRDGRRVSADLVIELDETPTSRGGGVLRAGTPSGAGRDLPDITAVLAVARAGS